MNAEFREHKTVLRNYLKRYPEERLAALLAHAQSGKLAYNSCCCLIGVETADHALRGSESTINDGPHFFSAHLIPGATQAEFAYNYLGVDYSLSDLDRDALRRRRIIPMIRAEFRRRDREKAASQPEEVLVHA